MIDNHIRKILPQYVGYILRLFAALRLTPNHVSLLGFVLALCSAYLVFIGLYLAAVIMWWVSRLFDACDGIYARQHNKTTLFGAFLDIQLDMAAYTCMIIAFYFQFQEFQFQWVIILALYVLCISGALGLGSLEKKIGKQDISGRGLRLASGLAEAGETGLAYSIFLVVPKWLHITTWIWIGILIITVVARFCLAANELKEVE
jgi:phosphatidylglycerophosphate synthase